jgi:antitoxin ParD1/3/4
MNELAAKSLLALWLAQQDTEARLSPTEESALEDIEYRLVLRPDTWESIEKDLMALIQGNANLNQAFQEVRPKLDEMDKEEFLDLLPSETEPEATLDTSGVVTYDSVASANKAAKASGVLEQLLVQLRREMTLRTAETQSATAEVSQERSRKEEQQKDEALALACALVDELELGWESEWQQAAITDWEASG